ncbi:MAG: invertase [Isosphaeraceae bacterium]|jgi:beta-fructofuranosidase|nr:MAG: invertase [Isosphaeraceae bacterium]
MRRYVWVIGSVVASWGVAAAAGQDEAAERESLLARANAAVAAAAARVENDPSRPVFHILPAAGWLNDPNGLLRHDGWYHVFFQHNPYGDEWGHMHWGHVRSRDLVRWERLPIALWPTKSLGEDHVFSGSAVVRKDGTPMLFYTSISGHRPPEQWAAIPEDADLVTWRKHPSNPILTESIHGGSRIYEWRDPYVFRHGEATYLVCGGNLNASQGGQGAVFLYRADDDTLTKWSYRGVVFTHPDPEVKNVECPILFPLDGRFVLITSQGQPVDWFVGEFDPETPSFTPTARGKIDDGQVYAPSVLVEGVERPILFGWINGVPSGKGWRHCLTLPRQLSIGRLDGRLKQMPYTQLRELIDADLPDRHLFRDSIEGRELLGPEWSGDSLWLQVSLDPGKARAVGLDLLVSDDGTGGVPIRFDGRSLEVAGTKAEVPLQPGESLHLAIYLDRSILEVVSLRGEAASIAGTNTPADGSAWISRVVDFDPARTRVALRAEGGSSGRIEIRHAYRMKPAWVTGR